ncbi:UvrD-helicase domain-containing protein [Stenotrophomonas sp. CFBP 13718]|uniref:UvrD-helicase domain-containing protein n=1 Tax=Stenotrophomonas sp. CFBP 13718 TaxID=2775304 RepID=UPI0017870C16|nr:UvrD-helicase domain-containing protein [Stenotrophomonas sp. CFBP 13718]MBD8696639.1 UvrD-helicase domain-containing protein [Stenotrophomonas sp. CFBP 13718]
MRYLAISESVASWMLGKPQIIDAVYRSIIVDDAAEILDGAEFVDANLHISAPDVELVAMWNADYLTGTGDESWGFVRLDGELGLCEVPAITRVAFERVLYLVSQRLQMLLIDAALFPRTASNGVHTCLAARGTDARQLSLAYFEKTVLQEKQRQQAIVCVGPSAVWRDLERVAEDAGRELDILVARANAAIAVGRKSKIAGGHLFSAIRDYLAAFKSHGDVSSFENVETAVANSDIDGVARLQAMSKTYTDWIGSTTTLTEAQRRILNSDALERHPIRIVGPGGSGKTLLMQLLCVRRLRKAAEIGNDVRILYLVHNDAMSKMVRQRFDVLLSDVLLSADRSILEIKTLSQFARDMLELEDTSVIDVDAHGAKEYQYSQVLTALEARLESGCSKLGRLFGPMKLDHKNRGVLAILVMSEISLVIKGQGLTRDRRRYVHSSRPLSRLHAALDEADRELLFSIYEDYHREVFEVNEVLDSDDMAISLLGRIRTPIWDLRRRKQGYDYIFVDETQLFNENERRIIPLLSNGARRYVPVALALDEAQSIYGQSSAGFAALGMEGMTSESLSSIHRSTKSIVELAFFVIQHSTDLFGADFPDFTAIADKIEKDDHPLAERPRVESVADAKQSLGKFVLKRVRDLRKSNIRQIAVIVHADQYWDQVREELQGSDLPLQILETRGTRIPAEQPVVVLTRPAYVGGQEFDAVVLVGLEQGVTPPRLADNETLSVAIEQQVLREIYLSVTRARYRVVVALSRGAALTAILSEAVQRGVLSNSQGASDE